MLIHFFLEQKNEYKEKLDGLESENVKLNNELVKTKSLNKANESKLQTQISKVIIILVVKKPLIYRHFSYLKN